MFGLLAAVEAEASGHPLAEAAWQRLCATVDSAAFRASVEVQADPGQRARIRRIVVTLTAQSAGNQEQRTFSLTSSVRPRNL